MMRKVALVLAVSLGVAGSALAINPSLYAGGGGPKNPSGTSSRYVVWSEPADINGLIASSEVISDLGIESEIANDFVLSEDSLAGWAYWWGGYYNGNGCGEIGFGTHWNLRFYNDGGCVPTDLISEGVGVFADETPIGCQAELYPLFRYEATIDCFPARAGILYWFSAQAASHTFPPQVGRLASMGVVNCESVFRAAAFSYPDWTPSSLVFGVAADFSQEFEQCIGTPTQQTTWGAVKGLYR